MPVKVMTTPANIRITCKACNKQGYASDFTSCDKDDCQLMGRRNKNPKPQAILVGGKPKHHPRCRCVDCLEADTQIMEATLFKAGVPPVNQQQYKVRMRVRNYESAVQNNDYDKGEEIVYVDVPKAVCTQIITLGKKK